MTSLNEPTREADDKGAGDALKPQRSAMETVILWVCKLGAAAALGYAGYLKLSGQAMEVKMFEGLDMEPAGRRLIGALEMGAAAMLLIKQSTLQGALLGLGVMCGAIIGHLTVLGLGGIQNAIVVAALCVAILYIRRHDATFIRTLIDR